MSTILDMIEAAGLTTEKYEKILSDIASKKIYDTLDVTWTNIIDEYNLNISKETLRKCNDTIFGGAAVYAYLKEKQDLKTNDTINGYRSEDCINKDGSRSSSKLILINEQELKDENALIRAHGYDPHRWELVSSKNKIWNCYSKQDGIQELYASSITVKPKQYDVLIEDIEAMFARLDSDYSKKVSKYDVSEGDKLLLIDISDLHMNLQASMFVTGNEYNCDIAEKLFFYVIQNIIDRTKDKQFERVIFCVGGDMLNSDTLSSTTTKGTPQQDDLHSYDAYERVFDMTIKGIEMLKDTYKCLIDVIYVAGNHDLTNGYKLSKTIDAWYRLDENVNVDYRPTARKYVKFGKTLFMFAHDAKEKDLPAVISDEARDVWSEIETTEVFLQHLHKETDSIIESNNMRIHRLPTISAMSDWSVRQGYGSKRQCKTFIFDKEDGLSDVLYTPIRL